MSCWWCSALSTALACSPWRRLQLRRSFKNNAVILRSRIRIDFDFEEFTALFFKPRSPAITAFEKRKQLRSSESFFFHHSSSLFNVLPCPPFCESALGGCHLAGFFLAIFPPCHESLFRPRHSQKRCFPKRKIFRTTESNREWLSQVMLHPLTSDSSLST